MPQTHYGLLELHALHPYAFDEQVIDGIRIHARRGVDLDRVRGEVEVAY